jgi:hypothetical protein
MRAPSDDRRISGTPRNRLRRAGGAALGCTLAIAVLPIVMPGSAWAATEVQGQPDDLQLHAENSSTREVLDALSAKFKLTYQIPASVGRDVTGHYSGTLRAVLARILDGNDYIVEVSDIGIEVRILGVSAATVNVALGQFGAPGPSVPSNPSTPLVAASESPAAPPPSSSQPTAPALPSQKPVPPLSNYLTASDPGATVPAAQTP